MPGHYVCVHPGARAADRRWPPAHFAAVADAIARETGLAIVLTGSGQEVGLTQAVMTEALGLSGGERVPCDAIFIGTGQRLQSTLAHRLGCSLTRKGTVKTDHLGRTRVPGVYVAGDASHDVQFAIVAAAEGAKAGVAINKALQERTGLTVE